MRLIILYVLFGFITKSKCNEAFLLCDISNLLSSYEINELYFQNIRTLNCNKTIPVCDKVNRYGLAFILLAEIPTYNKSFVNDFFKLDSIVFEAVKIGNYYVNKWEDLTSCEKLGVFVYSKNDKITSYLQTNKNGNTVNEQAFITKSKISLAKDLKNGITQTFNYFVKYSSITNSGLKKFCFYLMYILFWLIKVIVL